MTKRVWGYILMIPMMLLVVSSFGVAIYAAANKLFGVTWTTPIVIGVVIILFIIGIKLHKQSPIKFKQKV